MLLVLLGLMQILWPLRVFLCITNIIKVVNINYGKIYQKKVCCHKTSNFLPIMQKLVNSADSNCMQSDVASVLSIVRAN